MGSGEGEDEGDGGDASISGGGEGRGSTGPCGVCGDPTDLDMSHHVSDWAAEDERFRYVCGDCITEAWRRVAEHLLRADPPGVSGNIPPGQELARALEEMVAEGWRPERERH